MKIIALLPTDRVHGGPNKNGLGSWSVFDDAGNVMFGPGVSHGINFACDGKSDNIAAAQHDNPDRLPSRPYGDTPCGEYIGRLGYEPDTIANRHAYGLPDTATGAIPVIRLTPVEPAEGESDAWARQIFEDESAGLAVIQHTDMGLLVHSGPTNGAGQLRPTWGCLRTWQEAIAIVIPAIRALGNDATFPVSIQALEQAA